MTKRRRHLDHEVMIHKKHQLDAAVWCFEQFGERWDPITTERSGNRWTMFWAGREGYEYYRFCFALESDAILFALRWS